MPDPQQTSLALEKQVNTLLSRIITIRSNPHYRMADVFYRKGLRFADSAENVARLDQFANTILRDYIVQVEDIDRPDIQLLAEISDRHARARSVKMPDADELVIHIRAGDVVELDWFLKKDYVAEIGGYLPHITSCSFVTCYSFQEFHEKGWWMFSYEKLQENMHRMKALFSRLLGRFPQLEFKIVSSENIDDDFCYMVGAKYFIPDEGGFSALVCDLHQCKKSGDA